MKTEEQARQFPSTPVPANTGPVVKSPASKPYDLRDKNTGEKSARKPSLRKPHTQGTKLSARPSTKQEFKRKSLRKENTVCSNTGQGSYGLQLHFYSRQAWSFFDRNCVLFWSSTLLSCLLSNLSSILKHEPQHLSRFELCPKLINFKCTTLLQLKAFYKRVPLLKYTENKVIPFEDSSTSGCSFNLANYFVQNSLTLKAE